MLKRFSKVTDAVKYFVAKGGRFTLSDDAHGIDQVGTHFSKALDFAESLPIQTLAYLQRSLSSSSNISSEHVLIGEITLNDLKTHSSVQR